MSTLIVLAAMLLPQGGVASLATSSVRPDDGREVQQAWLSDLDEDGAQDLFVATGARGGGERRVEIHVRRASVGAAPCFEKEPDLTLDLTPDVVACGVGDVLPDAGRELVLFGAHGAYAWRPRAREHDRVVRLPADVDLLWQMPNADRLLLWNEGLRDLDGDRRDELVLPEPNALVVAWSGDEGFGRRQRLRVPEEDAVKGTGHRSGPSFAAGARELSVSLPRPGWSGFPGSLLSVSDEVPAPIFADYDGDGAVDLMMKTQRRLVVWLQTENGFEDTPSTTAELPIAPKEEFGFDLAFDLRHADLDGDRRADLVLLSTDRHSDELRTQVLIFPRTAMQGGGPFGEEGVPAQLLVLAGIASGARLVDVDGDGTLDLTCVSFRPDEIDQLVSVVSGRIDGRLSVFRGEGGRFSARPDLIETVGLGSPPDPSAERFLPDLNGDGQLELLEHDGPERIAVRLSRHRPGGELAYEGDAFWSRTIEPKARLVVGDVRSPSLDLLIVAPREVLHVRSR